MKRILFVVLGLAVMIIPFAGCGKDKEAKKDCADVCQKLVNSCGWDFTVSECNDLCKADVNSGDITQKDIDCVIATNCNAMDACFE